MFILLFLLLVCVNAQSGTLSITNGVTSVVAGSTTTYTIVLTAGGSNNGNTIFLSERIK